MTSHCITWHDTTQAITSHQMTWPSHDLTPQQTSRHQSTSLQSTKHHHHGTAKGSFTGKKWFGHRAGRSPCAHSIGKFFLWLIVFFLGNFRPRLVRALLVYTIIYRCLVAYRSNSWWFAGGRFGAEWKGKGCKRKWIYRIQCTVWMNCTELNKNVFSKGLFLSSPFIIFF